MRRRSNLERWVDARRARGEIPTTLSLEARRALGLTEPVGPRQPVSTQVWDGTVKELLLQVLRDLGRPASLREIAEVAAWRRGFRTETQEYAFRREIRILVEYGRVIAFDQRITDPDEVKRCKRSTIRMYAVPAGPLEVVE